MVTRLTVQVIGGSITGRLISPGSRAFVAGTRAAPSPPATPAAEPPGQAPPTVLRSTPRKRSPRRTAAAAPPAQAVARPGASPAHGSRAAAGPAVADIGRVNDGWVTLQRSAARVKFRVSLSARK